MFETAVVRARAADRRWLSLSLVVHVSIVIAVIAASVASTRLPNDAPKQMMPVFYERPLPVLTPSQPVARPQPAAAPPKGTPSGGDGQARLPVLHTITAPVAIPQSIPSIDALPASGPIGIESGKEHSTGNDVNAPAAPDASGPLVAGAGGVTSPTVIRRIEPVYPQLALRAHMSGVVVLQCVIDKSGRIRDVQVVRSSFIAFEQPAIDAVKQWLFAPGTLNGQPVDVIFELTVKFEVR